MSQKQVSESVELLNNIYDAYSTNKNTYQADLPHGCMVMISNIQSLFDDNNHSGLIEFFVPARHLDKFPSDGDYVKNCIDEEATDAYNIVSEAVFAGKFEYDETVTFDSDSSSEEYAHFTATLLKTE